MKSVNSTVATRNKDLSSPNTKFLSPPRKAFLRNAWCWMKVGAVGAGAIGLVGASAYFNGLFGLTTSGVALAIAAVCFDLLKPVFHATKGWAVAAWVATAMSLVAAFSFQTIQRNNLSAQHAAAVTEKSDARSAYERALERRRLANAELATLPITRPVAATQAEIRSILRTPGVECDAPRGSKRYGPISKRWCPQIESLKAGLAVAQRRAELLTVVNEEVKAPSTRTMSVRTQNVSAPASAFAGLLAALGISITADFVAALSILFYVIGLEIGSSRALVLVRHIHGQCFPREEIVLPRVSSDEQGAIAAEGDGQNGTGPGARVASDDAIARENVVRLLKANDGQLQAAQRRIAEMVGVSAGYLNKVLKAMAEEGEIVLQAHRTYGTRLKLATA